MLTVLDELFKLTQELFCYSPTQYQDKLGAEHKWVGTHSPNFNPTAETFKTVQCNLGSWILVCSTILYNYKNIKI